MSYEVRKTHTIEGKKFCVVFDGEDVPKYPTTYKTVEEAMKVCDKWNRELEQIDADIVNVKTERTDAHPLMHKSRYAYQAWIPGKEENYSSGHGLTEAEAIEDLKFNMES